MAQADMVFIEDDWVVHPNYGIGRIKCIEDKRLGGESQKYYRVEGEETAFWIPVEGIRSTRVRKVMSRSEFHKAVKLFENPPNEMDPNFKTRRQRIDDVVSEGMVRPTIRLIRDLWAYNKNKRLNDTEKTALRNIMDNLVGEWAVAEGISNEEAAAKLNSQLEQNLPPSEI
jgi:RNA polymerase-interacting CarD/CdnL/TRCF family regulator